MARTLESLRQSEAVSRGRRPSSGRTSRPGTSKWNKIEHRLFSFISANWRGRPLTSLVAIVNLIAATKTQTGLRVRAEIDKGRYPKGVKVALEKLEKIRIKRHDFHGDWN